MHYCYSLSNNFPRQTHLQQQKQILLTNANTQNLWKACSFPWDGIRDANSSQTLRVCDEHSWGVMLEIGEQTCGWKLIDIWNNKITTFELHWSGVCQQGCYSNCPHLRTDFFCWFWVTWRMICHGAWSWELLGLLRPVAVDQNSKH